MLNQLRPCRFHHVRMETGTIFHGSRSEIIMHKRRDSMAWTTPVLVEIPTGMEVTGYHSAQI